MKFRRRGYATPRSLAALAVGRGCRHYAAHTARSHPSGVAPAPDIPDEELAVALLSPANPYDPALVRIGGQMLSAPGIDPARLVRLAEQERCGTVLRHIAGCGQATEPANPFWSIILEKLPPSRPAPAGVLPHISRFRLETGIHDPRKTKMDKIQWLRPAVR